MKMFQAKRMLKLADHLDRVPRRAFDMGFWLREDECGTVACAIGHACLMPAFRRAGLSIYKNHTDDGYRGSPSYNGREGIGAPMEFFGIGYEEACSLFSHSDYGPVVVTPKMVAKRLRHFVKEHAPRALSGGRAHA